VLAVIEGLKDGTIDAIATDHAPHALEEKDQEFSYAPPGMVGLETALGLALTKLVSPGHLTEPDVVTLLSTRPAELLGLDNQGHLSVGVEGNVCVFDPSARWQVEPADFRSLSHNTPFRGWELTGKVVHTFYKGRQTVDSGRVTELETA
jgi:dihydroorotase